MIKKRMDNRGFLLAEETIKMIIALIGIVILVYVLAQIYFNYSDSKELEEGKAVLNNLIAQIIEKNPSIEIYNPEGWWLVTWPVSNSPLKPKACLNSGWVNCICICKKQFHLEENIENLNADCDDIGYCTIGEKPLIIKDKILIENVPLKLQIDYNIENILIDKVLSAGEA